MNDAILSVTMLGKAPVLRETAKPVERGRDVKELTDAMRVSMRAHDGIGIAAPQVGESLRIFLVDLELFPEEVRKDVPTDVFINPKIKTKGFKREKMEEGCLSIPQVFGEVSRAHKVQLRAFDADWNPITLTADGLLARVFQHEVDHLNGMLFVDRAEKKTLHKLTEEETLRPWNIEEVEPKA